MTTNTQKKKPERRCVGCGENFLKTELIRIVKTPENEIKLDQKGKMSGRGAYLCNNLACLKKARKSNKLSTSLKQAIPDEVYQSLEAQFDVK